jgi:hypothetical protein
MWHKQSEPPWSVINQIISVKGLFIKQSTYQTEPPQHINPKTLHVGPSSQNSESRCMNYSHKLSLFSLPIQFNTVEFK